MALAAGLIVALIGRLFNRLAFDVGVSPRVKLQPIKPDPLFSNGEFADVRAYRLVEFVPAHAEVAVGITGPDESGRDWRYLGGRFVCHSGTAPGRAGRRKGLCGIGEVAGDPVKVRVAILQYLKQLSLLSQVRDGEYRVSLDDAARVADQVGQLDRMRLRAGQRRVRQIDGLARRPVAILRPGHIGQLLNVGGDH